LLCVTVHFYIKSTQILLSFLRSILLRFFLVRWNSRHGSRHLPSRAWFATKDALAGPAHTEPCCGDYKATASRSSKHERPIPSLDLSPFFSERQFGKKAKEHGEHPGELQKELLERRSAIGERICCGEKHTWFTATSVAGRPSNPYNAREAQRMIYLSILSLLLKTTTKPFYSSS
jgi:hypothetical protein